MKTSDEKEKKLNLALSKLKKLNFENPDLKNSIEKLSIQKNQLEIENRILENAGIVEKAMMEGKIEKKEEKEKEEIKE